jgi:lipopolysaccharide transport system permease protein
MCFAGRKKKRYLFAPMSAGVAPSFRPVSSRPRFGMLGWFVGSLSRHWDLLWQMALTDLRGRYIGSSLGLFWSVIHPLVMILIYTLVFSKVMGAKLAGSTDPYGYGLYLCTALLPWIAFQEVVIRCTTLFPDNANLVRKIAFPKSILYGFVTLSTAINLLLALGVFVLALIVTRHPLHPTMLLWLPLIALQLVFGLGLGVLTSILHVFIRDTAQMVGVLFQVLFWMTPIVYVESALPASLQQFQRFNPLRAFSASHRMIVLDGAAPSWDRLLFLVGLTAATLALAVVTYRRFRGEILDEL